MKKLFPVFIFIIALISNCDFFSPRPSGGGSNPTGFRQPTQPTILIENLVYTLNNGDIEGYMKCFDERTFKYVIDIKDTLDTTVEKVYFRNWNISVEDTVIQKLFRYYYQGSRIKGSYPAFTIILYATTTEDYIDSSVWYIDYRILVDSLPLIDSLANIEIRGKCNITMELRETYWYISSWQDFHSYEETYDWSQLKALFRRTDF